MKHTIVVKDVTFFKELVTSIMKFTTKAKFIIDPNGLKINSRNESGTTRMSLMSSVITCSETTDFCLSDLHNLSLCLKSMLDEEDLKDKRDIKFYYDGAFFGCNDGFKFKLTVAKEEVIAVNVCNDINTKLENVCWFTLESSKIRKVCGLSSVANDASAKAYIYKDDNAIVIEVTNKTCALTNSITVTLSKDFGGDWSNTIISKLDNMSSWNPLNVDSFKVTYALPGVIVSESCSKNKNGDAITVARVYSGSQKK